MAAALRPPSFPEPYVSSPVPSRPPPEEPRQGPPRRSVPGGDEGVPELRPLGALWLLLVHLLAAMGVGLVIMLTSRDDEASLRPVHELAIALVGPLAALYVGLTRYAPGERTLAAVGLAHPGPRPAVTLPLAALAGACLVPLGSELAARLAIVRPVVRGDAPFDGTIELAIVHLAAALLLPPVQEALVRGLILPRLRRTTGTGVALVVTSVVFVAASTPHGIPGALLSAFVLGALALLAGSTWPPLVAALAAQVVTLVAVGPGRPLVDVRLEDPRFAPPLLLAGCLVGLAGALLLVGRIGRRPPG